MKTANEKIFVSAGNRNEDTHKNDLLKTYPAVYQWLEHLNDPYLSESGERTYANRFKLPLETFQAILRAHRGEGELQ